MKTENEFPRRIRLDLNTPAELAIYNAIQEVEKAGADVRLTNAVIKLTDARRLVADFVDDQLRDEDLRQDTGINAQIENTERLRFKKLNQKIIEELDDKNIKHD